MEKVLQIFSPERPLRLEPCPVWRTYLGGSLLARWRGMPYTNDGHFPEDWLGSTTRANNPGREAIEEGYSVIAAEHESGIQRILLKELLETAPQKYLSSAHVQAFGAQTGVLVKLLDSAIRLPIQAHPSKEKAQMLFGSRYGKTESWYVLDTREDVSCPYVLLGFKKGITREQWMEAYRQQDIERMRGMLHKMEVKKGEMYLVEPGVPHAIGEGCLLVESQEPSDLVFRTEKQNAAGQKLNDEICSMGVGVEAMMDCFLYGGASEAENREKYQIQPELLKKESAGCVWRLLGPDHTDCFEVQRLWAQAPFTWQPDSFRIVIVTEGNGKLACSAGAVSVRAGETWFLPAGIRQLNWVPEETMSAVICCPPRPQA